MEQNKNTALNMYSLGGASGGPIAQAEIIESLISKTQTATVVKILSVNEGGAGDVGVVSVLPLVMQTDVNGFSVGNVEVFNLPYFRLQGGINAVIIDPQVGDIGLAIFASRDISAVKRTKKESAPSSRRKYDLADGLYIGGFLNGAPQQYIHFLPGGGINAVATGEFNIKAPKIVLDAPVETTSTVKSSGDITDNTQGGNSETMASMRQVYNSHNHKENGEGRNTDTPNQKV